MKAGTLLLVLAVLIQAAPVQQEGFVEGAMGFELDSLADAAGRFIHTERISWGVSGNSQNFRYNISLGGVMQGNSANSYISLDPEYGIRTDYRSTGRFDLGLFSYLRLRNPMQVRTDSLAYREYVHGVKLKAELSKNSSLSVSTGLKFKEITHRDSGSLGQQFISLNLDQKLGAMQFRIRGETDAWGGDERADRSSSLASIYWYGNPSKQLNWTASNSIYVAAGNNFWRLAHRLRYTISPGRAIWATFQRGDFAYDSKTLLRQKYDLRYRFIQKQRLGFDLMAKGNRVGVPDSLDIYHWRMYGASTHWRTGSTGFTRGNLDVGYKESFRFGKGLDGLLNAAESFNIIQGRRFDLYVQDDLSAELFVRLDEESDPRYDIRHKIRLTTEFSTLRTLRYGNHIKFNSHFGSDLDFSPDTLKNAVIDELFLNSYGQKTQFALYFGTIYALLDPQNDLHFNLNTRFYHRLTPGLNFSFFSTYRFASDIYADHLWLNATLKYQTNQATYALMLQNYGLANTFGEQGTSVWLRVMRQI